MQEIGLIVVAERAADAGCGLRRICDRESIAKRQAELDDADQQGEKERRSAGELDERGTGFVAPIHDAAVSTSDTHWLAPLARSRHGQVDS